MGIMVITGIMMITVITGIRGTGDETPLTMPFTASGTAIRKSPCLIG
jgi:hypothetical protein